MQIPPRCPSAFETCGWSPGEVRESLTSLIQSGRHPTLSKLPTLETEIDESSFDLRMNGDLSDDDVKQLKAVIETEVSEGNRALKAIKDMEVSKSSEGSNIVVKLYPFRAPKLGLVKGEHRVACHLYKSREEALTTSDPKNIPPSICDVNLTVNLTGRLTKNKSSCRAQDEVQIRSHSMTSTGLPNTSSFGMIPSPGFVLAVIRPLTRRGAPSAVLTVT